MEIKQEMDATVNAATSPAVKIWLNWMLIVYEASLLFVWKHKPARFVVGAFILTIPVALLVLRIRRI